MATFHQIFSEQSSAALSTVSLLAVGVIFSIQALFPVPMVHAQTESINAQASMPPSPRLNSALQYFGSSNEAPASSVPNTASEQESVTQSISSEKPYVGDEGIPVMAETVVEGSAIDSFPDPFDVGPQTVVNDPWESFNADVFQFNYDMDRYLLKPVAKGYNAVIPPDVQGSLANAFNNMGFMTRFLNSLFQGKYGRAGIETKRFLINSTIGVAGLFDVAKYVFETEAPPSEDTGQTLALYGMESGPFLILPFMPPLTVRDAVGYVGDVAMNPLNYFIPFFPNFGLNVDRTVNDRSLNLDKFAGIEESTVDLYGAVRSGYFDSRAKDLRE
ncbi:MAG: VacJ family lipoprotein [Nitrospirae bacterium]|nr:VacJ family lipoprotein [Nitrospirota bacterium]MDA1304843.1 VacJ family lipoprotein [Nitrospirota bacterium]